MFHTHFKNGPEYLTKRGLPRYLFLLGDIYCRACLREVFLFFCGRFLCLSFFVLWCLHPGFPFFFLSKRFDTFLIRQFYSFCCPSFPNFYYQHDTFFYVKISHFVLSLYSYCLYQCLSFSLLFTPLRSFQTLPDGFSQEFEWKQVCSSLQDSSQYSAWSKTFHASVIWWSFTGVIASFLMSFLVFRQFITMDTFDAFSNFQPFQSLFWALGDCPKSNNYYYYLSFLSCLARLTYLSVFLLLLIFPCWSAGTAKSNIRQILFGFWFLVWSSG